MESTVIGTETVYGIGIFGADGGTLTLVSTTIPATLGGVLSATGNVPNPNVEWANYVGVTAAQAAPVATSGQVQYVQVPTVVGSNENTGAQLTENLWYVQTGSVSGGSSAMTLTVPAVTETTTTTQAVQGNSVIAAGNNLTLTATSLNNQGGTISAGNVASLNVQSLSNGGSAYTSTVTDAVDIASLNAFLAALQSMQSSGGVSVMGSGNAAGLYSCTGSGANASCFLGPSTPPTTFAFDAPGTVTPPSVSSSVTVQGATGQIVAGHNLNLSGGNLTNAGTLAAGNDVNISAASFTNQGTNTGTMTTTAGCASGYSAGCSSLSTTNPNSQTYSYQQTNSTVTAGNDIVIAASSVNNTYGTLAAGRNVVIGGAGTTASDASTVPTNLTQAASVTNTSGSIAAGTDVDINAATLTNTIAAPVQVHQNYGSATPFTGCAHNCEAYVDVQSAAPATITANHDVNLTAASFSNTGSLVTALNNVTINAGNSASSNNQDLNAYWASSLVQDGTTYTAWGCSSSPSLCQTLYGGAYNGGAAQDPAGPASSVNMPGFVPATIQAGNTLSVSSPTLTNTGNVVGQNVALSGSQLVNGLTNPNVYTPPPAISGQVITLGPPAVPGSATTTVNNAGLVTTLGGQPTSVTGAAGLPSTTPLGVQTVGKPVAPTVGQAGTPTLTSVQTINGQTVTVSYLVNSPASQVVSDIGPASLLASLPASLQPSTTQFYYDPYTQAQQVEQAALEATGQTSFYSTTTATDSTSQTSINNQDTQALYGAALQYAEQNNIALGTQLSAAQLAQVNQPMLWYTEETVPEPGCTATGNGACPTVQALMPEVLLPQNYAEVNADGTISGTNVSLNYSNNILNTGSISASGTLSVNTGTLTNEERSANVGTIYTQLSDGIALTTGTVVQQGGFMSAANYDLDAQSIDYIGGAIQQVNADGTVNQAATSQLLSSLKSQLGSSFTQSTVSDDLHTQVITDGPSWEEELLSMVAIAVIAFAGGEVASGLIGGGAAAGSTFAAAVPATTTATGAVVPGIAAGVGNLALSAGAASMLGSAISQEGLGGSFSLSKMLEAGGVATLTAGLINGITVSNTGSLGFTTGSASSLQAGVSTLGQVAGVAPSIGSAVPQSASSIAGNVAEQGLAITGEATIQAGVQTLLGGGSFLNYLKNAAVSDVAAAGAGDIGANTDPLTPQNVLAEAALGCAAGAASGSGCASGALGGASSALVASVLVQQAGGVANLTDAERDAIVALSMGVGGTAAGLLGLNVSGAANAAENESLNNATDPEDIAHGKDLIPLGGGADGPPEDMVPENMPSATVTPAAMSDILLPDGQPVGFVMPGAGQNIQTVNPTQFAEIEAQLMDGATPVTAPASYSGTYYQRSDGTVFGIRTSIKSGTTIDVITSNTPSLPSGFKVHQQ
jgi:filamentous hemagglutinin